MPVRALTFFGGARQDVCCPPHMLSIASFEFCQRCKERVVPAPKPLHFAVDDSIVGSTFYVMSYVDGQAYSSPRLSGTNPL